MTLRILALTSVLLLSAGLAGCGKVGQLERPGPLFGGERNIPAEAEGGQRRQDPTRPVDTVDPRDRDMDPSPPRTAPIPGTGPSPGDLAPRGALPDPYADPRR